MTSIARSFCQTLNWSTRSLYGNKDRTLTPDDPLALFLAANTRWVGCAGGGATPHCAAAVVATPAKAPVTAADHGVDTAASFYQSFAGAPFDAASLPQWYTDSGAFPDQVSVGVVLELCPPSPRLSLFNVSTALAEEYPSASARHIMVAEETPCRFDGTTKATSDTVAVSTPGHWQYPEGDGCACAYLREFVLPVLHSALLLGLQYKY